MYCQENEIVHSGYRGNHNLEPSGSAKHQHRAYHEHHHHNKNQHQQHQQQCQQQLHLQQQQQQHFNNQQQSYYPYQHNHHHHNQEPMASNDQSILPRKRGRPFGSKNKPKNAVNISTSEDAASTKELYKSPPSVERRGRSSNGGSGRTESAVPQASGKSKRQSVDNVTNNKKKLTGPYVHVEREKAGTKVTYSIVNVTKKADEVKESSKRGSTGPGRNLFNSVPNRSRSVHHLSNGSVNMASFASKRKHSTSAPSMDSIVKDNNWICIFCQRRSHYRGMGDLFGSHFIPVETRSQQINTNPTNNGDNQTSQREVWYHEDCLVWSNGVYLVGNRLRNIEEVIKDCYENICCECKLQGASLGCLHKGCSPRYHYLCAKEKNCDMDEETFSIHCPKHKKKNREAH